MFICIIYTKNTRDKETTNLRLPYCDKCLKKSHTIELSQVASAALFSTFKLLKKFFNFFEIRSISNCNL